MAAPASGVWKRAVKLVTFNAQLSNFNRLLRAQIQARLLQWITAFLAVMSYISWRFTYSTYLLIYTWEKVVNLVRVSGYIFALANAY